MAYIGKGLDNGVRNRFIFAATQGQKVFTGSDLDGKTLTISDALYCDVYHNGVKIKLTTDWSSSTTTMTLVTGASVNDVIEIISFDVFGVPNTVPSFGGTFTGAISATSYGAVSGTTGTFSSTLGVTGVLSADNNIIAGNDLTANYNFTQGAVSSATSAFFNSTANWNYPQLQIKRDASNTASFKAMSFLLNGDTPSDTNLYNYPNIIITTDTAPTTSDTSVAENASLTINTPSQIRFGTNGSERLRILSSGGITFNGDTAAANALDDYEEGTWTPSDQSGAGMTLTVWQALYTKIGRKVYIEIGFALPSNSSTADVRIGGLPFTSISGGDNTGGFALVGTNSGRSDLWLISRGTTYLGASTNNNVSAKNNNYSNNQIKLCGSYTTA